jgi:hypothetical protein
LCHLQLTMRWESLMFSTGLEELPVIFFVLSSFFICLSFTILSISQLIRSIRYTSSSFSVCLTEVNKSISISLSE